QELIEFQLEQRQKLQGQFETMRKRHEEEMQNLMANMIKLTTPEAERDIKPDVFKGKVKKADLGVDKPKPDLPQSRHQKRGKDKGHEPDA
ncbi:MAG: hypothetical protein KDJ52_29120, partial [Anaerolineae bacterium]|nr:hypothetical protein [Anaerolineae bacterium]